MPKANRITLQAIGKGFADGLIIDADC